MSNLEDIFKAGIVGMGGAGFPTYTKLSAEFEHIIVNAVECEPLLRSDRYVVIHHAASLARALEELRQISQAKTATIALKKTYKQEIAALEEAVSGTSIRIKLVDSYYPAGDEQSLVYDVLGEAVPPLGIPLALKAVVINASTLLAISDAFQSRPLTHRYISVAGAVERPTVLYAPIGTSFQECLEAAGGMSGTLEDHCIVSGGPMMGKRYPQADPSELYVEKTTSGVLCLPLNRYHAYPLELDRIRQLAKTACIQCVNCTELCPRYLLGHPLEPHKIMRILAYNELEDVLDHPTIQAAQLCCECGICETYACPMQLKPRDVNALIKKELRRANLRYTPDKVQNTPHVMREFRKVETRRAATRVGVGEYYDWPYDRLVQVHPKRVSLSLKQGVGAPSEPLVQTGSIVEAGELIAKIPRDKLGANLHAPISGRVTEVSENIVIER